MLVIKIAEKGNIPQGRCAEPWGDIGSKYLIFEQELK
jgi:hypothetical protein